MALINPYLILAALVLGVVLLVILYKFPVYTFPLYYLLYYFEVFFLRGSRQRILFAVQIIFFLLYFITYAIRNQTRRHPIYKNDWVIVSFTLCLI